MARDAAGTPTPGTAPASDAGDDGFLSESHSVMDAVEAPAADTTAETDVPATTEEEGTLVETAAADEPPAGVAGTDVESASAAGKPPKTDTKGTKPGTKAKDKHAPDARKRSLQSEVDELTFKREEARREWDREEAERTRLRGQRATEDGAKPPVAAKPGAPAADKTLPAEGPRPVRPKVKDFEDFEKYEDELAKWEATDTEWLGKREARLRSEIEAGIDTRLKTDAETTAARDRDTALAARITAGKAKHADFGEKVGALKDLRSSWYKPEAHGRAVTPFLSDLVQNADAPADLLYFVADLATTDPDRAQRLVDLHPTRALRDAMLVASSPVALLEHFSTEEGAQEFETIKGMQPHMRQAMALGALETRLSDASRGPSDVAPAPITRATPSAKPPAGSPRAREGSPQTPNAPFDFNKWMAEEDAKEVAERKALLGA